YRPPVGVSEDHAFRAIWDTFAGIWYPVAWIGPISNIGGFKRATPSSKTVRTILEAQNNACKVCFAELRTSGDSKNCDVDHILPVSLGGNNGIDNLQILCVEDHRRKTSFE
ncbi:unnamed protein product, partial [Ectocarpus sp. 12 AP-2014]